jgi:hypothetical protein
MGMRKSHIYGVLIFLVYTLWAPFSAGGADNDNARQSLRGHAGIYVWIVALDPDIEREGLSEALIRKDVVSQLQGAGIRSLSKEKWFDTPGNPYLYVNANVLKLPDTKEYIYSVQVFFKQTVYPLHAPMEILGADTWSTGGRIGITGDLNKIRKSIGDLVQQFIRAYRSVNPI